MTIERGPVAGAPELTAALEAALTHLETLTIEHSPDCSYGATTGPHGDFCDCGLKARRVKRSRVYAQLQAALSAAKAPQGVPARDFTRPEGLYLKFSDAGLPVDQNTPVIIERVNGDCSVSEFIIARDEAYKLVGQLSDFLGLTAPSAPSKLPVPGPVSDDTIHQGMVPPLAVSKLADEVNQCLQIIVTNAGNWPIMSDKLKGSRSFRRERKEALGCLKNIEAAVERAKKATCAALAAASQHRGEARWII